VRLISSGLASLLILVLASAQPISAEIREGTRISVTVSVKATARAQLAYCDELRAQMHAQGADEYATMQAVLTVVACLSAVPSKWPNATEDVIDAYRATADLLAHHNMQRQAIEALEKALPISMNTPHQLGIQRRLGSLYARLGDTVSAEAIYLEAETSAIFDQAHLLERAKLLNVMALFYSRTGRPAEAMKRFRKAAELGNVDDIERAALLVASLEESMKLRGEEGRVVARREFAEVQALVGQLRSRPLNNNQWERFRGVESDFRRLERKIADN
jgi:tetratricopeptide (TPR) repeat protein